MTIKALAGGASALAVMVALAGASLAEEGMWTFDQVPIERINRELGTDIDQAWLDDLRAASVRLTSGCSASVVSPDGLMLTNHHCVLECVQELSSAETDYVQSGFVPATREDERTCPGMTAQVLVGIDDVTDRIMAAGEGLEGDAFVQARNREATAIQTEACGDDPTHFCQVVSFYRGGQYKLYRYRQYTDVRLAFAPEFQAAFFGGDPDNFNFPRYALDAAFLRAYEDGRPVSTPDHLTWSTAVPEEGDATFVSGNPGTTNRLLTLAQLETARDIANPINQLQRSELRGRLIAFASQSEENARIALDPLFGVENSFKAAYGQQLALVDRQFMAAKAAAEDELRARVAADPELAARIGDPWAEIADAQAAYAELYLPWRQLEGSAGGGSTLYTYARTLVRSALDAETNPDAAAAARSRLAQALGQERTIDPAIEQLYLEFWLSKTREYLTVDHPAVRSLLGNESPEALAERLVEGTSLADPAARLALLNGGIEAIRASNDPLIQFVLANNNNAVQAGREWNTRVTAPTARAAERIAQARFAVYGTEVYPDATFTLRLSYGRVQGWTARGQEVEPYTYMGGLYERATGAFPFNLASRWEQARGRLDADVVYNYVTTNDIIGGNSGSPVVNAEGEVVGAAFDGNIWSLGGAYGYDGTVNRTVVVSTAAITEALRSVYGHTRLLDELGVD